METITIPKTEYFQLITLFQQLTEQLGRITYLQPKKEIQTDYFDIFQFCGSIKLNKNPLKFV